MTTTASITRTMTAVHIDLEAPAKAYHGLDEPEVHPITTLRVGGGPLLREPNFYDEGRAVFIGDEGVLEVDVEDLEHFARLVQTYDRQALRAWRLERFDGGKHPSLSALIRTVTA